MTAAPRRVVAVDWSGAATGAARKIWLAEVDEGGVARLEDGRNREALVDELLALAAREPSLVVGLDFSFSLPAWFLRARRLTSAPALWRVAADEGERWLRDCEPPFWGRPGRGKPALESHFRATELAAQAGGIVPKSTFQVGGAGTVGTGSLRGMPALLRLRAAGFAVWPFDAPALPMAVEIYPRALTGPVVKSSARERAAYLAARHPALDDAVRRRAAASDDAFDALVSALAMWRHRETFARLAPAADDLARLEGAIWAPPAPADGAV